MRERIPRSRSRSTKDNGYGTKNKVTLSGDNNICLYDCVYLTRPFRFMLSSIIHEQFYGVDEADIVKSNGGRLCMISLPRSPILLSSHS